MASDLDNPLSQMNSQQRIAAWTVGALMIFAGALGLLLYLPRVLQAHSPGYLSALGSVAAAEAALFTLGAALVAAVYVWLTHRLVKQSAAHREADLMLTLIDEYDGLRDDLQRIQSWYMESAATGVDPVERFRQAAQAEFSVDFSQLVDDARFSASRFFVRTRRLVRAGYLSETVVTQALDPSAIELFLTKIDPLDEAKAGAEYKSDDREFFQALLLKCTRTN